MNVLQRAWWCRLRRRVVLWFAGDLISEVAADIVVDAAAVFTTAARTAGERTAVEFKREADCLRKQLAALQAVDVGFHETGKIILVARIGEKHIVKIIDVAPQKTFAEYGELVARLAEQYGVRHYVIDGSAESKYVIDDNFRRRQ